MNENARATEEVVRFVSRKQFEFPGEAIRLAKRCIVDGLGVMLAGSTMPGSRILQDYVRSCRSSAQATVLARDPFRADAAAVALANGTSGHALDFDDTQLSASPDRIFGLMTHPTMPPLSAALALAERERISGKRFLEAFLIGFEVECKIAEAIDPSHYKQGFHSSGTLGAFGAMAAAARLLSLGAPAVSHALSIVSSFSSGIRVNFGTMTKPLHVGRAAQNGIVAAELAARGFTGGREGLDGPWGYLSVFSFGRGFDPDRLIGRLGNPYTIVTPGVSIKPYPCGVLGHPSMDAMRKLVIDHDVKPDQIRRIRLRAGSNILNPLRYAVARSELEAKFCPAFMLSSIALRRKAGIHEFTDAFVRSAPVQEMMARVETLLDPEIEARGFDKIRSIVEVDLRDGRQLVQEAAEQYRGGPDFPFTDEELHQKFAECGGVVLDTAAIQETLRCVESIEELQDISELMGLLTRSGATQTQ